LKISAIARVRYGGLIFLLLASWVLTPTGSVRSFDTPSQETSLTRTEIVVIEKSEGQRSVQRWMLMAFSTDTHAWMRVEIKARHQKQSSEAYFIIIQDGRVSARRYRIDSLEWLPGEISPDHGIFDTKLQFQDLLLVQGGLNKPVGDRLVESGFEIFKLEGEKELWGIKIKSPDGWTRTYKYIRTSRSRGVVFVQKFRLSVQGEENSVLVEFKNRKRLPSTLDMFRKKEDFLAFSFDTFEAREGSED
jgi:hypothetical protein